MNDFTQERNCPAIFISAPGSGQGKTTVAAALAYLHKEQGLKVRVFKAGPDFLDPMILERASGHPVYQLDLWMMGENECRRLLYDAAGDADVIIVEGVMGLYDGTSSSADLAARFSLPIALVVDAASMAQTFGAVALGLTTYQDRLDFVGVLANKVASERHAQMLREGMPPRLKFLGSVYRETSVPFPERHLGLLQASEIADMDARLAELAAALQSTDLVALPKSVRFTAPDEIADQSGGLKLRIAIAKDLAFSFLYQANLDFLISHGAQLAYFSPMTDAVLPECDCLYLPGGYPELYACQLEANFEIKQQIREHVRNGKPIYAECGGMLYLLDSLTTKDGRAGKMLGLLPGRAIMQERLVSLGYQSVVIEGLEISGHTFHYSKCLVDVEPIAYGKRSYDAKPGEPVYKQGNLFASYLHLYFNSQPRLARCFFSYWNTDRIKSNCLIGDNT
jgi:cobyrinic acid a,c-diamide synthase